MASPLIVNSFCRYKYTKISFLHIEIYNSIYIKKLTCFTFDLSINHFGEGTFVQFKLNKNMKIKSFLIITLTLFVIWVILNGNFSAEVLGSGAVVALLTSFLFCRSCNIFEEIRMNPKSLIYTVVYIFVFIIELVKSNFDVARRVVSPKLPINPGIVEVKTKLKSKIGRMILANSITLTPGTFTVEITGDRLFIHWIDVKSTSVEEDTNLIVRKFEKYLEVIYG